MRLDSKKLGGYEFYRQVLKSPKFVVAPMVDQKLADTIEKIRCAARMIDSKLFAEESSHAYRDQNFNISLGEEGGLQDRPLIVQFCGNKSTELLTSALLVQDHCDAVDLNLCCPQEIARQDRFGSYLQDDWDLVFELINVLHTNLRVPVTVKFRIFPDINRTVDYAKMIERAGAQILTCHGRTREQYGRDMGLADWTQIAAVKRAVNVPVFANGNILCSEDVKACLAATGADGVMSAEGNLYNPAIFAGLPCDSTLDSQPRDHAELALEYLDIIQSIKTETAPSTVKEHLFRLLWPALQRETDLREELDKVICASSKGAEDMSNKHYISDYVKFVKEVQNRMERDKMTNPAESSPGAQTPHWFAQSYVRSQLPPPQNKTMTKIEPQPTGGDGPYVRSPSNSCPCETA